MTASPDFSDYLRSIATQYAQWWELYTLMDAVGREQVKRQTEKSAFPFDFGLMVQTAKPVEEKMGELPESSLGEKPEEQLERLPVLAGMRKYAAEHVLLVGRPGSGKSTALIRLLLEESEKGATAAKIPVLVELRYWQTGVIDRILTVLQQGNYLDLDAETLKTWLRQGRLLLLIDGLNELPSEEARRDVATFRRDYLRTPMIFTTRELSVGGDLGIAKKLEMQPLTEAQMQEFVRTYLPPNQAEQMLRQLKDRLRELGQTPLLLWMLCGLFQRLGIVPPNLGMVFRQFTQGYERSLKEDIPVTAESRRWWSLLLQRLAFVMMQGENPQEKPTELQVAIAHQMAEDILTQYLTEEKFDKPRDFAKQWLEDLLKHHLIQINGDKIEFRHQLIQEYYAAEYLLRQLPKLSDAALQRQYLNYLKWTEAIVLMLALVEDEALAVRVVELAIGVDLMLGARLVREVNLEFQEQAVTLLTDVEMPELLKVTLLGIAQSQSQISISILSKALSSDSFWIRGTAVEALGNIANEVVVPLLIQTLNDKSASVCRKSAEALGNIGHELAVTALIEVLKDKRIGVRASAAHALGAIGSESTVIALTEALNDENDTVQESVASALSNININSEILSNLDSKFKQLIIALKDEKYGLTKTAAKTLDNIDKKSLVPVFIEALESEDAKTSQEAARVLGFLGGELAVAALAKVLNDEEYRFRWNKVWDYEGSQLRSEAVYSLGEIGNKASIDILIHTLNDESSDVFSCAAYALSRIGNEDSIDALIQALNHKNVDIRKNVTSNLGYIRSEKAVPILIQALGDKDLNIRRTVVEALGDIGSKSAISGLIQALNDKSIRVRRIAAYKLGKLLTRQ